MHIPSNGPHIFSFFSRMNIFLVTLSILCVLINGWDVLLFKVFWETAREVQVTCWWPYQVSIGCSKVLSLRHIEGWDISGVYLGIPFSSHLQVPGPWPSSKSVSVLSLSLPLRAIGIELDPWPLFMHHSHEDISKLFDVIRGLEHLMKLSHLLIFFCDVHRYPSRVIGLDRGLEAFAFDLLCFLCWVIGHYYKQEKSYRYAFTVLPEKLSAWVSEE